MGPTRKQFLSGNTATIVLSHTQARKPRRHGQLRSPMGGLARGCIRSHDVKMGSKNSELIEANPLRGSRKWLAWPMLMSIRLYQRCISPLLPPSCRFYPTCSSYGLSAISQHGPWKGAWLTFLRITRCHPFHPGGYDPVPPCCGQETDRPRASPAVHAAAPPTFPSPSEEMPPRTSAD